MVNRSNDFIRLALSFNRRRVSPCGFRFKHRPDRSPREIERAHADACVLGPVEHEMNETG